MNLHEMLFASKMSGKSTGNADLSDYYTKSQTNSLIAGKVDKVTGKGLSANDFTDDYKSKIDGTEQLVTEKVAEIVANAPEDFDTLKEISDWIESHEDSAAAMNTAINNKVDKVSGKGLSTNDFTNGLKTKLDGLENYDDTAIKAEIAESSGQTALNRSTLGYQRKNLLKNSDFTARDTSGVVITDNSDGTYSLSGTPTATADYFFTATTKYSNMYGLERGRTYTISSGNEKIVIRIDHSKHGNSWDGPLIENIAGSATFTVPDDTFGLYIRFRSPASAGDLSGVVLKPMIRHAVIKDNTYEPYTPSVKEDIVEMTGQTALNHSTLGYQRKNMLKNTAKTATINGITFTVNADGSVTANGTASANAGLLLSEPFILPAGKYYLNGCSGGANGTYRINLQNITTASNYTGDTVIILSENTTTQGRVFIQKDNTVNNLTFYPMLRYSEIKDDTYEPYKPSIEERLTALENAISGGILND